MIAPRGDDAARAHRQRDGHAGAAECTRRAVDDDDLAGLQARGNESAVRHQIGSQAAPRDRLRGVDGTDGNRILGGDPYALRPRPVVHVLLQAKPALVAGGEALEHDGGRPHIIARAHRGIAKEGHT